MRKSLRFMSMLLATAFVMLSVFIIQPAFALNANLLTPAYGAPDFGQNGLLSVEVRLVAVPDHEYWAGDDQPIAALAALATDIRHLNDVGLNVAEVRQSFDVRREIRQFRPEVTYPRMP